MKLNRDMGESFGSYTMGLDAQVVPYIDMANIACSFHASDPLTLERTVKMALAEGDSHHAVDSARHIRQVVAAL